jgi:CheY-like chemotaxis protein
MKALVVEDEEDIRVLLARLLESEGCEVKSAADGLEAIRLIEAERFDLVLLDLALPLVDGVRVARHLREVEKASGASPAYVLGNTGYGNFVEARGTFERAGIDELREKPLDPAALSELIRSLLKGN